MELAATAKEEEKAEGIFPKNWEKRGGFSRM